MAYLNDDAVWEEGVRQLEETDDCVAGVFNVPLGQLTRRTKSVKKQVETVAQRVESIERRGRDLTAHDFGTDAPTPEDLSKYAAEDIWGAGGEWVWDADEPWNSGYVIGGVTHTLAEFISATWVRNTFNPLYHDQTLAQSKMVSAFGAGGIFTWNADDPAQSSYVIEEATHYLIEIANPYTLNDKWIVTNTADTTPRVFSWENVGQDSVAIANELLPGVVKSGGDIDVDPVTGLVRVNVGRAVHPVNSYYVQYPAAATNDYDTAFPSAERPATLFGGTWSVQWEDSNKVCWRSGGTLDAESDRENGLQGDAIRDITGKFGIAVAGAEEIAVADGGLFTLSTGMGVDRTATMSSGNAIAFKASNVVPIAAENRPINRRMIIWKRTA